MGSKLHALLVANAWAPTPPPNKTDGSSPFYTSPGLPPDDVRHLGSQLLERRHLLRVPGPGLSRNGTPELNIMKTLGRRHRPGFASRRPSLPGNGTPAYWELTSIRDLDVRARRDLRRAWKERGRPGAPGGWNPDLRPEWTPSSSPERVCILRGTAASAGGGA